MALSENEAATIPWWIIKLCTYSHLLKLQFLWLVDHNFPFPNWTQVIKWWPIPHKIKMDKMPSPAATGTNRTTKRPAKLILFCIEMHWSTDFRGVVSLKQIILDECFLNLGVPHNPLLSPWNVLPPCLLCPPDFASRRRKRPLWRLTMELVKLRLQTMSWIFNNHILIINIYTHTVYMHIDIFII